MLGSRTSVTPKIVCATAGLTRAEEPIIPELKEPVSDNQRFGVDGPADSAAQPTSAWNVQSTYVVVSRREVVFTGTVLALLTGPNRLERA